MSMSTKSISTTSKLHHVHVHGVCVHHVHVHGVHVRHVQVVGVFLLFFFGVGGGKDVGEEEEDEMGEVVWLQGGGKRWN